MPYLNSPSSSSTISQSHPADNTVEKSTKASAVFHRLLYQWRKMGMFEMSEATSSRKAWYA